jgi:hypothetical protein
MKVHAAARWWHFIKQNQRLARCWDGPCGVAVGRSYSHVAPSFYGALWKRRQKRKNSRRP